MGGDVLDEFEFDVFKFLRMNNGMGICFGDFIGVGGLDWVFGEGLGKENRGGKGG